MKKQLQSPKTSFCWLYHSLSWSLLQSIKTPKLLCAKYSNGCILSSKTIFLFTWLMCTPSGMFQELAKSLLLLLDKIALFQLKHAIWTLKSTSHTSYFSLQYLNVIWDSIFYILCHVSFPNSFWYWQNIELHLYYLMYFKERNHHLVLAGALGSTMYSSGSIQSVVFKAF